MFWRITRDHLYSAQDAGRFGFESAVGFGAGERRAVNLLTFKIYDDDGECYYTGVCDREALDNDTHPNGLYGAYQWAMRDAGATDLRVNGESIYG